jgi:hypothetical protein
MPITVSSPVTLQASSAMVIYTAIYILSVHFSVDYSVNDVKTLEPPGYYVQ